MQYSLALLGLAAVAYASPAAVTSSIAPTATSGCATSYSGDFEIEVVNVTSSSKRDLVEKRTTALVLTLADGTLKDAEGRTGYIASNYQFQFDKPPQAGAIYTAGWSVCSNGSLTLGDDSVFYQCLSGTFYNLYDESTGSQCSEILIEVLAVDTTATVASESSDGQVTASAVTEISDGQIQATTATAAVVTEISDGQIQATTSTAKTSTAAVVTEISDGQIQATTGTTSKTSTAAVVTEISDGQIQATTGTTSKATTSKATTSGKVVSQISDGQIQASTGSNSTVTTGTASSSTVTKATASTSKYTGAAAPSNVMRGELFALAAGVLAVAAL